ncbi:hypothetical protein BACFRA24663_17230 [Bacteroides fragilis]
MIKGLMLDFFGEVKEMSYNYPQTENIKNVLLTKLENLVVVDVNQVLDNYRLNYVFPIN